ncbi:MAG: hypothetical protein AAGD05_18750, partial [Bacteroidota bacterium]
TPVLNNLSVGVYTVTISQINGCSTVEEILLEQPAELGANVTIHPTGCGAPVGSIALQVGGGTPPYQYLWNTGSTQSNLLGLGQGAYQASITDQNNCQLVVVASVPSTGDLDIAFDLDPISCFGATDGAIDLDIGGVNPLFYVWSNGALTQDVQNLPAGIYTVTIALPNGCLGVQSIELPDPMPLEVQVEVQPPQCANEENGLLELAVSGGTPPYAYDWSNGSTEALINAGEGDYTVHITDANGCTWEEDLSIPATAPIQIEGMVEQISCHDAADGQITLMVSGGTGSLLYSWNTGASSTALNNLSAGFYTVLVLDDNGCAATTAFQVIAPTALEADITPIAPTGANNNGSILIVPSGGVAPYQVTWSNGATDFFMDNLPSGTYNVTVTDASNCQWTQEVDLILTHTTSPTEMERLDCFPNPTKGQLNIDLQWKNSTTFAIQLYDVLGRQFREKQYTTL